MCGFVICGCVYVWVCNMWMFVCVGFVICGCLYVWVLLGVSVRMSGYFGNMCPCIYCVLYCLYCVFALFRLCIFIVICFVCTSVKTTATE